MSDLNKTPVSRPRVVTVAFWVWAVAAIVLLLLGLLSLTISADTLRAAVQNPDSDADGYVSLVRGVGVIFLIVGLGVAFMTGPVGKGHIRFRRALAALSMVFGLVLIGATFVGLVVVPILGLLAAILLLVAAVLSFRPSAAPWFDHG